jgi:hypothetical protein
MVLGAGSIFPVRGMREFIVYIGDGAGTAEAFDSPPLTILKLLLISSGIASAEAHETPVFVRTFQQLRGIESVEQVPTDVLFVRDERAASVFIGGAEVASRIEAGSLRIQKRAASPNTATFSLWDHGQTFAPVLGAKVAIYWRGERIFGGIMKSYSYSSPMGTNARIVKLQCDGFANLLTRRLVNARFDPAEGSEYDATLKGIVRVILSQFFVARGVEIYFDEVGCPTIPITEIVEFSQWETGLQAMDKLAELTNTDWFVDDHATVHFILATDAPAATFNLLDNDGRWSEMDVQVSSEGYANVIMLKTAAAVSGYWTDTFMGENSIYQMFLLTYAPKADDTPLVKVNGVAQRFVSEIDPASDYQWSWLPGSPAVFPRTNPPALVPFALTDVITVTYRSPASNVVIVRDEAAIALYGEYPMFVDMSDRIDDYETAVAYANGLLTKNSIRPIAISYMASESYAGTTWAQLARLAIGSEQAVALAEPNVNASILIDSIELFDVDATFFKLRIGGANGRARKFWDKTLADALRKSTPASKVMDNYGFRMAEDAVGVMNPGMVVTGGPVLIRFVARQAILTTVVLRSPNPPDAGRVRVDLLLNGASILPEPISYSSSDANVPKTVTINVRVYQYDELAVNVLEIGSGTPGSNFTLIVTGLPTGAGSTEGFK